MPRTDTSTNTGKSFCWFAVVTLTTTGYVNYTFRTTPIAGRDELTHLIFQDVEYFNVEDIARVSLGMLI